MLIAEWTVIGRVGDASKGMLLTLLLCDDCC